MRDENTDFNFRSPVPPPQTQVPYSPITSQYRHGKTAADLYARRCFVCFLLVIDPTPQEVKEPEEQPDYTPAPIYQEPVRKQLRWSCIATIGDSARSTYRSVVDSSSARQFPRSHDIPDGWRQSQSPASANAHTSDRRSEQLSLLLPPLLHRDSGAAFDAKRGVIGQRSRFFDWIRRCADAFRQKRTRSDVL